MPATFWRIFKIKCNQSPETEGLYICWKLFEIILEINWSYLYLQHFDKFWRWTAINHRKRKCFISAEFVYKNSWNHIDKFWRWTAINNRKRKCFISAESLFDKIREITSSSELLFGRFYLFRTTVHGVVAASKFTVPWSFLQVNRLSGNLLHFSRKSNIYIRGNPQMTHSLLKPEATEKMW